MTSEQTPGAETELSRSLAGMSLATRGVHGDDGIAAHAAVAPAMHVSTTFRYSDDPEKLTFWGSDVSRVVFLLNGSVAWWWWW